MEFAYTPEQIQLRQAVRDFAETEIGPNVLAWDEDQIFPLEVIKQAGKLGYLGAIFPEELGGAGLSYVDYAIIIEELSRVDPSVGLIVAAHNSLCTNHIFLAGNDEQKRKYIPKLATGEWIGCWSLTEPEAGSDAAGTRSKAVKQDSCWVLNGGKTFTTNAQYANVCVAMAVTDRAASHHGISAFILESGIAGFRVGKKENKLGMRASDTCTLVMEDCRVPAENLLGAPGEGFLDSMKILDGGRISIAALSVGIARGAYEAALKYSKERRQFGRPISEFQAIRFYLAEMATEIDASRLLTERAAQAKDRGEEHGRFSAQAKYYASEAAVRVTDRALQIHGGYGFIKDFPVEKFYRDVKLCTIGEGTTEIQKLVIAKSLLGNREP
jgi:alkylation response protein AidB-like acyl-CoA dehydrogenase